MIESQEITQLNKTDSLFSRDILSEELVGEEVRLEALSDVEGCVFVHDKVQR